MAPVISPVQTSQVMPKSTTVVVIGGGIVGLMTALTLIERGVPVVVVEKGRLAGEQSSRNLGWVRKTSRSPADLPMALESDRLWSAMAARVGEDVGYRQAGIMFLSRTEAELDVHRRWMKATQALSLDSRLITPKEIDQLVPGGTGRWVGGVYTPSDGRAEPTLASSAIARAAMAKGAVILENCAVRTLSMSAGKVSGVVTEKGEIACEQVVLAGGLWSRRFLDNLGVFLPTLPLECYAIRTAPMDGPTEIAVGGPDFSFRKRADGGFTICQRGAVGSPLVLDHALLGMRYLPMFREGRSQLRISFGKEFFEDLRLARRWSASSATPFEKVRTMDPRVNHGVNAEAMDNVRAAWPAFAAAKIEEVWGGTMDITPDSLPVIDTVPTIPGLIVASGFSGHGFGTAPAAGQLAADLVTGAKPIVEPTPYRLGRLR